MRFLLFAIFFLYTINLFGQTKVDIDITVLDMQTKKKEPGVTATVYNGSQKVASSVTTGRGLVNLNVPAGPTYKVVFSKAGKVTRFFTIDSKGIDMELIQGGESPLVYAEVSLFDKQPNIDYSYVTNNPFTKFYFDGKNANLAYDKNMASNMSAKIDQLMAKAEQSSQMNEVHYQAKMKEADALAAQKKYQDAMKTYEQALMFKSSDKVAIKKIDEMEQLMTANQVDIVNGAALDTRFDDLKKEAEALKAQKKYQEAIDKYEEALDVKKGDLYVLDEIDRLEAIIKKQNEAAQKEKDYAQAMALGNQMFGQKSYKTALDNYEKALAAKPNDPTATAKKQQTEQLLNAAKAEQEKKDQYEKLIADGDALYKDENWKDARDKYQAALAIQSASTYAQGRIKDIDTKLADIQKKKELADKINQLLADANTLFVAEKWQDAKTKYQAVQQLSDTNSVAKSQIAIIDKKLADIQKQQQQDQQFAALVKQGDDLVASKKYQDAVTKYQAALAIKTDDGVKTKLDAVNAEIQKLADAAKVKAEYDADMKAGMDLLATSDYSGAREKFDAASKLDPTQQLPKDKITEIDKKLADIKAKKDQQDQFNALVAQAEELFNTKDYAGAKAKYQEAKKVDASSTVPDQKIKEIDALLAQQQKDQELATKIAGLLATGKQQLAASDFENAIATYNQVLTLDANNDEAKAQLALSQQGLEAKKKADAEALAAKQKAEAEAKAKTEADAALAKKKAAFSAAIAKGDAAVTAKKYQDAISAYNSAYPFADDSVAVNAKIANVQALIAQEKAQNDKQSAYLAAMTDGQALQAKNDLQGALTKYQEAKNIDPSQTDPDKKIAEVNQLINDLAQKEQAEKARQQQITDLLNAGDELVSNQKYAEAIAKYQEVLKIDDKNTVAPQKINSAQTLLQQALASKSQQEKEDQYNAAFDKGVQQMQQQQLDDAIASFKQAAAIDPSKTEPQQKIDEINKLKVQLAQQKEAEQLSEKYNAAIQQGEAAMTSKDYATAITAFTNASNLMPNEEYPKQKIKEAQDALELAKSQADKEATNKKYNDLLQAGDQAYAGKNYQDALTSYQAAKAVKSTDEVNGKITDTQKQIATLAQQESQQAVQKQYDDLIAAAKTAESTNQLEDALQKYKKAGTILPNEQLPKDKVNELTAKIASAKSAAEKDAKYAAAMTAGQKSFDKKDYNDAIKHFEEASFLKPNEQDPKDQIALAQEKLKNISNRDEDVQFEKMLEFAQRKIDEKDYPKALELIERAEDNRPNEPRLLAMKKQVNELMNKENQYKDAVAVADKQLASKDFKLAIENYQKALDLKPQETYPATKITEAKELLAKAAQENSNNSKYENLISNAESSIRAEKFDEAISYAKEAKTLIPSDDRAQNLLQEIDELIAKRNQQSAQQKLKEQFKSLVAQADNLFENGKWTDAKEQYQKALIIDASDNYVKEQIEKCNSQMALASANQAKYIAVIATADQDFKAAKLQKALDGYKLALTYDNSQTYPKDKIAEINNILAKQAQADAGYELKPLGEKIDITLEEGVALLAKAEDYRKNSKGELIKEQRRMIDSLADTSSFYQDAKVAIALDSLKKTKDISQLDWNEYQANKADLDKIIFNESNRLTKQDQQLSNQDYVGNLNDKAHLNGVWTTKLQRDSTYGNFKNALDDSIFEARKILDLKYSNDLKSDYDEIMQSRNTLKTQDTIAQNNTNDDVDEHYNVIAFTKDTKNKTIEQNARELAKNADKIDSITTTIKINKELDLARNNLANNENYKLTDAVKNARNNDIQRQNDSYNDLYAKVLKARKTMKQTEADQLAKGADYSANKVLDIDKSRTRMNEALKKFNDNQMSDDALREDARKFLKNTENTLVDQNAKEKLKSNLKIDNVSKVANTEKTLFATKSSVENEQHLDIRDSLKLAAQEKVAKMPSGSAKLGKDFPEGVSQEIFKQNGPDGLPIAIITRRIVVINGFGNVYTRTQRRGSITYAKNGVPCAEAIWINETTDPKLKKNY